MGLGAEKSNERASHFETFCAIKENFHSELPACTSAAKDSYCNFRLLGCGQVCSLAARRKRLGS
jgi:hypothetical protein